MSIKKHFYLGNLFNEAAKLGNEHTILTGNMKGHTLLIQSVSAT